MYRGQADARIEGTATDACHAVGDGDGGQADTARVFASRFISMTCNLNGRKVLTCIL